jgi:hypothetical protein
MYASESPGTMAIVQTTTSTHRKVGPQNFRFGFIAASALDRPLEPDEPLEHGYSRIHNLHNVRSARFTVGCASLWKYWQELQSKVPQAERPAQSKRVGLLNVINRVLEGNVK